MCVLLSAVLVMCIVSVISSQPGNLVRNRDAIKGDKMGILSCGGLVCWLGRHFTPITVDRTTIN